MKKTLTSLCSKIVGTNGVDVLVEQQHVIDIRLKFLSFCCKYHGSYCKFSLFHNLVMYEVGYASKKGSAAVLS